MRKFLLSTSTIAGMSLMSSVAMADVSVSGTLEFEYEDSDSNITANDGTEMNSTNEIGFLFTSKTDSGLTISYDVDIHSDQAKTTTDDNALSIEGGFGKLRMGQTDGVEDAFAITPNSLVGEESAGALGTTANIMTGGGSQLDGNGNGISYYLPEMNGLAVGITYKDGGLAGGNDTTAYGMNYSVDAGGAALTLGYTTATTEAATQDSDATTIGASVTTGGVTFIAAQTTSESVGEDITGNEFGASYTLPSGLKLAAMTFKSEDDIDTGEEYTVNHYEATYTIASGLSAVVTVSDFDYETGTVNSSGKDAQDGTITTLNIKASF